MALGPSATGLIIKGGTGIRYKWLPGTPKYETEELTSEQLKLEKLYTLLRTNKGIDPSEFNLNENVLRDLVKEGIGEYKAGRFIMNSKNWIVLDSIVQKLL